MLIPLIGLVVNQCIFSIKILNLIFLLWIFNNSLNLSYDLLPPEYHYQIHLSFIEKRIIFPLFSSHPRDSRMILISLDKPNPSTLFLLFLLYHSYFNPLYLLSFLALLYFLYFQKANDR